MATLTATMATGVHEWCSCMEQRETFEVQYSKVHRVRNYKTKFESSLYLRFVA